MNTEALPIAEGATTESAASARAARRAWGLCVVAMIAVVELVFRIAGGSDPKRLHLALWIDGKLTRSATGRQMDTMVRQTWDIRAYRGKMAEIRIVDDATESWGYIAVDEIVQWVASDAR